MHKLDKAPALRCIAAIMFFQVMGGLMGWITSQGVDGWYQGLERSPANSPDWAFGVAWTILYFLLSLSFWRAYELRNNKGGKIVLALFAVHMILNWLWSPLFFTAHELLASYLLILVLIFTAAMIAYLLWPLSRAAALAFIPYIVWLTFAGHLSEFIWRHN